MPCPLCEMFACYERQLARRLDTNTFAMSVENAHELLYMATQIRRVTRATLRELDNEIVPTMLCDLLDGLAQGLIDELSPKLDDPLPGDSQTPPSFSAQPGPHGLGNLRGAPADSRLDAFAARMRR